MSMLGKGLVAMRLQISMNKNKKTRYSRSGLSLGSVPERTFIAGCARYRFVFDDLPVTPQLISSAPSNYSHSLISACIGMPAKLK